MQTDSIEAQTKHFGRMQFWGHHSFHPTSKEQKKGYIQTLHQCSSKLTEWPCIWTELHFSEFDCKEPSFQSSIKHLTRGRRQKITLYSQHNITAHQIHVLCCFQEPPLQLAASSTSFIKTEALRPDEEALKITWFDRGNISTWSCREIQEGWGGIEKNEGWNEERKKGKAQSSLGLLSSTSKCIKTLCVYIQHIMKPKLSVSSEVCKRQHCFDTDKKILFL